MTTTTAATEAYRVWGRVRDEIGAPVASGVAVQVADLRLGGEHVVAETEPDPDGGFTLVFDPAAARSGPGASLDLVVRVVARGPSTAGPIGGSTEDEVLARSATRFDAGPQEVVDVVVPASAVRGRDEYSRVVADIGRQLRASAAEPAVRGLADLVEDGSGRRDVTFVAAKSGWDVRRVAMASLAEREESGTGIPAPLHYALYRVGLPAGDRLWSLVPMHVLETVWGRAITDGVIAPELATAVPEALDRAAALAGRAILDLPTGAGGGRFADLLASAAPGEEDREQFLRIYREHRDDPAALWARVREELPADTADRLELDGALARLTRNNTALIARLHASADPRRVGDLAAAGFHHPRRWREELTDDVEVPDDVPGGDDAGRRDTYAALLAEELRLRHPTAVLGAEMAEGLVPVAGPDGTADAVAGFLAEHHDRFELAVQPVDDYVDTHGVELTPEAREELTALQRIVAVAPTPEAIRGLRGMGFDSARSVAVLGETAFVGRTAATLGEEAAREAFRRSDQVHTAALATATSHLVSRAAPDVFAVPRLGPAAVDGPGARALAAVTAAGAGVAAAGPRRLPTLETLFGPGDAAATEHCESVLGPAAYLVDLLEFADVDAADLPAGSRNPQEVLLERRPDLQHIALSCENTEVELPYVDVVNEILEQVVVHSSIDGYEGHDVPEGMTSAELLASPLFVDDAAYTVLRGARYPLVLPWDQRLAALRAYLAKAGPTLHEAMAVLTPLDAPPPGSGTPGRAWPDVVLERTGLGPADRDVLTGSTVTAQELYGDDPGRVSAEKLVEGVGNARRLARRLQLSPAELVTLVRTRFVNPDADLLGLLGALRVGFPTLKALDDGTLSRAEFLQLLPRDLDTAPYGGDVVAWLRARHDRIMDLVLLTDPTGEEPPAGDSTHGWARLELRRALPDTARNRLRAVDLLGIARFVRLASRLGWTIERTDAVLTALWPDRAPASAPSDEVRRALDKGFDTVLRRLGHLLTAADLLELDADDALPWLLGCVAPLGLDGPDAPYRRLFLTTTLLGMDPVFGLGPDGRPPTRPGALLLDHGPALQAALKLTAEEFAVVVRAAGAGPTTPLTLDEVSRLFRYGYLARALRLGVAELVALIDMTGWTPFAPLDDRDPDFLRLIRLARLLRDSGLPVARLATLVQGDGTLPDRSDAAVLELLRSVRAALAGASGPVGGRWTEPALRALLASVFPPDVVDEFLGLLADASTYTTPYTQEAAELPEPVRLAAPGLAYDDARSLLLHRGVLPERTLAAITALPDLPPGLPEAVARLANAGQAEYLPLFRAHPVLASGWEVWVSTPADPADPAGDVRRAAVGEALLAALTPTLRRRRIEEVLVVATGADAAVLAALLDDPVAVSGSAPGRSLGDDLAAATTPGLTARFWAGAPAGEPVRTAVADGVRYGPGGVSLREAAGVPTGPISGVWAAAVEPPVSGRYTFSGIADGTGVALRVGGTEVAVDVRGTEWSATPVELTAGRPVAVELSATRLEERLELRWQADGVARVPVPATACCPADAVEAFTVAYRRLRTALELAGALGLSVRELLSFARSPRHRVDGVGWLSLLPGPLPEPGQAQAVVAAVAALAQYRELRGRWAVTGTAVVDLLDAVPPDPPEAALAALLGADPAVVAAAAAHLGTVGDELREPDALRRVGDLVDLVRQVPLPVPRLAAAVRGTPSAEDVRDVRDSLRARYDEAAWHEVVRPVHDELRRAARDALVGRVLHVENPDPDLVVDDVSGGFTSPDQLYERLLVDVQMDPCMTTSRVAQAISTVQLFVARCLLNLEPEVSPAAIDPHRWEAMKRYRVWEANRRVFLFPENWLDPELRDDKSPFFRDVETELLQSDITDQAAATALGHYLEKLDEVANLEIAGMHVIERTAAGTDVPDPIVHVVGRTFGAKRGYFHRTLDGTWLPWEPVNVEIQDDPVLPVIWKGRFLLFWLRVTKEPDRRQPGPFAGSPPGTKMLDLAVGNLQLKTTATLMVSLFWSEYYNGRWQSPRTSDPDRPIDLGAQFTVIGDPHTLRLASDIKRDGGAVRDSLGIIVLNPGEGGTGNSWFRLHTTHSLPVRKQDDLGGSVGIPSQRQFSVFRPDRPPGDRAPFVVTYEDDPFHPLTVLRTTPWPFRGVGPMHRLQDPHRAPFFFQDSRHVFYVHPKPTQGVGPGGFGVFPEPIVAPGELVLDPSPLPDSFPVG